MDTFVTAEKREIREERERLGLDAPLSAPSPTPSPSPPPLPAVASHSVTHVIPDPASYGDPSASAFSTLQHVTPRQLPPALCWEHVRASPSPPPVAVTTTTDNNDVLSGPGMFDKASERLRELSSTVGSKIEQFAASHKDFQKQNATPNQRTPVVSDAEKEYYGAKESSERAAQKDQDRLYEASMI